MEMWKECKAPKPGKRNWFKSLDTNKTLICGEDGTAESYIPFIFIEPEYKQINIVSWQSCYYKVAETFETEEELDSFIEALQKAKKVFHIKEMFEGE